ncbi:hypothetical protein NDS46_30625 (plasmid) [Paenibacillus thiaminolyticus]|uniref:hypothetical protein n=1 Tax=Paenibacillus thiaminolyticus TaxID=49283 RepID=UPI00232CDE13|nr:hypothetical protein [Paenibacillus thiaminolyticus]WCF11705.1 hypothetical protein NDS46_30625 [Paenibacillus thiaminolyticus]
MSKSLITFIIILVSIIALVTFGIPYIQSSPNSISNGVHFIDGFIPEKKPVEIGIFEPIPVSELNKDEASFLKMVLNERGVYRKGDLIVLTIGNQSGDVKGVRFVRQENYSNEVRLYIEFNDNSSSSSVLIGRMKLSNDIPFSFIDESTGDLFI